MIRVLCVKSARESAGIAPQMLINVNCLFSQFCMKKPEFVGQRA
jgi:hypothetical protein